MMCLNCLQVCRKIWLGLFDARTSLIPDSRDPQKVKEFLQEKYEKKRWYGGGMRGLWIHVSTTGLL